MHWRERYKEWLQQLPENDNLRVQLSDIQQDGHHLEDCFYKDLEFGTGGMRGIIGPGTNRMNIYTVRKLAAGLADYIKIQGNDAMNRGVAISYDSRHLSREFAEEVAKVLGYQGIKSYLFDSLHPTPLLSFAVRHIGAFAGIMITASHNPPEYNGLKVYGEDGAQLPPSAAEVIVSYMEQAGSELQIGTRPLEELEVNNLLEWIGEEVDQAYLDRLKEIQLRFEVNKSNLSIVFTGLHGTGTAIAEKAFNALGYPNIIYVEEQAVPDPQFTTVTSPNPEEKEAFNLAVKYGKKYSADLLLATDPDADRLGVAVKKQNEEYQLLTGNQIGAILIHYILEQRKLAGTLPENGVILKTIVTTDLARSIAERYGIETKDTLTGFKFIAENIQSYNTTNEKKFLFGYEESYGFLVSDFVRDKDAIQAAVLVAEAAAYYRQQQQSLLEILGNLFDQYGYHKEITKSIKLEGKDGAEKINQIMDEFRQNTPKTLGLLKVKRFEDYRSGEAKNLLTREHSTLSLPTSDVLKYILEDGSWVCIRPSGTEPKIKFYIGVKDESKESTEEKVTHLEKDILNRAII
ncbi:phospho-sugar mutase [Bhargavaea beijingensis]|uniref:Phosphoglucomutase n=1 Tax=Bhargavaea beijingensis TaxID=426756 RepID=A0ABX9ZDR1_9BACL|nr:phospho-sugar mutase [Bhargavaea beijingensis]RSK33692.1 phospho-sugar mutase [Bhargavaea beijingensis]